MLKKGDKVKHIIYGSGIVEYTDTTTYSIPFTVVDIKKGKCAGSSIIRSHAEWEIEK